MISPRISCSVKFFEPTTMRFSRPGPQETSNADKNSNMEMYCFMVVPGLARAQSFLEPTQSDVGRNGENCSGNRSRKNDLVIHHRQSAKDVFAQPACADRRSNRCQTHGDDGSDSDPGDNDP